MSNIQTGAERMPHDLSHLGFLAGQIGRLITISTPPFIVGAPSEMAAVAPLRLSPLRGGLAIDSIVDILLFMSLIVTFMVNSGINTILHELNPLFTINVTIRDIKSKKVYIRVITP